MVRKERICLVLDCIEEEAPMLKIVQMMVMKLVYDVLMKMLYAVSVNEILLQNLVNEIFV